MNAASHGPLLLLLLQIIVIVGVSRALGFLTQKAAQPLVIAEIVAGVILGPSLLGWLWPPAAAALFPASSLSGLKLLSSVGLVLFMFLVGLEFDPRLFKGRAHASVVISHVSILVPFALGAGAAWVLYPEFGGEAGRFVPFLLFLGISMSVTAFPVLARVLSERNLLGSRVGSIAIACAAVDDVTAWCLLAFVVAVARAHALLDAGITTLLAGAFIAGMVFLVRPFARRLGARVLDRQGLTPTVMAITLLLLFSCALATEWIGIHALFGAFLFGAVLPKEGGLANALVDRLENVAVVLLLPLFFAYSGLRTQIGLIDTPAAWGATAALIVLATAGKFGGSALAARATGLRWREAGAIGVLMNTRGLMELIVLNIGLDLGVISPTLFTMLVMMALVTTFLTTPVLNLIYPQHELARDRLTAAEPVVGAPGADAILMCVSDARSGPGMTALAHAIVGNHPESSRLIALHLAPPSDRPATDLRSAGDPEAQPLAPLIEGAKQRGVNVRPLSFVSSDPAQDICRTAEAKGTRMILLGWHKPLLTEGRLGGVVSEVLETAPCPVGVLFNRGLDQVRHVLVPFSGGPADRAALQVARWMHESRGVAITVLHVVRPDRARSGARAEVVSTLGSTVAADGNVELRVVVHESPVDAALEETRNPYDLVILGMTHDWGLRLNPVDLHRERILKQTATSVLVVHAGEAARAPAAEPNPSATGGSPGPVASSV